MNEHDEKTKEFIVVRKQMNIQWNSDFSILPWKQKLVQKTGEFEKSGIKVECLSTRRGKRLFVQVVKRFEKMGFREIEILL